MKTLQWLLILFSQVAIIVGFWMWNHINHPMGNLLTGDVSGQFLAYGRLTGLLAAFGILLQIILAGRVKWVERTFGLDRLLQLHHIVGFGILAFLVAHPLLLVAGHSMQAGVTQREQWIDFLKNWPGVFAASAGFILMLFSFFFCLVIIRKRLRFETWYLTHWIFYIAIALAFSHQLLSGSDFTDNRYFAMYWKILYLFTFGNLIFYRVMRPIWFTLKHRFYVSRVVRETEDVCSVYIGGRNMKVFPVEAGQFMIVRFFAPGFRLEAHPFSVSCTPDGSSIRLTIKALGDYTRKIPDLKPGTKVYIDGPHGVFTLKKSASPKVMMIAGGIGVTPIRSLAGECVIAGKDTVILYANRNQASMVFSGEFDELVNKSKGSLRVIPVMNSDPGWSGEKGNVDIALIRRLVPDYENRDIFLCGPPPMMKMLVKNLLKAGVHSSRIHYERFAL